MEKANSFKEVQQYLKKAREHGYVDSYIVAYQNGTKIPVEEAIKAEVIKYLEKN